MNKKLLLHTETTIDSCHHLVGYDGLCQNKHGHTWFVEIWFKGESRLKDKVGILVDFGIVKELKEWLDHRDLNEEIAVNPTAENLTEIIYDYFKEKVNDEIEVKVRLYETMVGKKTWCEWGDF